ncbi:hypothetical protein LWF15_23715 [Kineosporia rhizophila]|uniref:glycosyl hydrolase n=1 Tax=Kineosporia rhizophila TaxID=84633 RepID=UPI001E35725D|nr:glycosyl hydrolase [Kineosporia rhizophila]MCE0538511.1 hypothetical protein [Kineosporia rhizophila]
MRDHGTPTGFTPPGLDRQGFDRPAAERPDGRWDGPLPGSRPAAPPLPDAPQNRSQGGPYTPTPPGSLLGGGFTESRSSGGAPLDDPFPGSRDTSRRGPDSGDSGPFAPGRDSSRRGNGDSGPFPASRDTSRRGPGTGDSGPFPASREETRRGPAGNDPFPPSRRGPGSSDSGPFPASREDSRRGPGGNDDPFLSSRSGPLPNDPTRRGPGTGDSGPFPSRESREDSRRRPGLGDSGPFPSRDETRRAPGSGDSGPFPASRQDARRNETPTRRESAPDDLPSSSRSRRSAKSDDRAPEGDGTTPPPGFAPRGRFGRNVDLPRGERGERGERADATTPAPPRPDSGPQGLLDREPRRPSGLGERGERGERPERSGPRIGGGTRPGSASRNNTPPGNRGIGPRPQQAPQQGLRPVKKTWRDWRPNQIVLRRNQVLTLGLVTVLVALIAVAGVYRSMTAPDSAPVSGTTAGGPEEEETAATASTVQSLKGRMGAYTGTDAQAYREFEDWWGMDLKYVVDFGERDTWDQISNPSRVLDEWDDGKYRLVMAVPMLPTELLPAGVEVWDEAAMPTKKQEMAKGAEGAYDSYFTQLGENLVAANQSDAILRIGWEMNIESWMWGIDDPKPYREYFQQIVKTMRAVPGAKFEFDFNVNNGYNPNPADKYYPGDKFVDYIGIDVYDLHQGNYPYGKKCNAACKEAKQERAWTENIYGGTTGLGFWTQFAADHKKPVSIPEWGLWDRYKDHTGGLDNPNFIRYMHDYLTRKSNNVAYANYFEFNSDQGEHSLIKSFPNGAKVFKELFGPAKK